MRRRGFFWGIILVFVGVIFLLDNLGVFDTFAINVWGIVLPVILLLAGFWLVYGAIVSRKAYAESTFSIPSGSYEEATIEIDFQAGELRISADADPDVLVQGEFEGGVISDQKIIASGIHASLAAPGIQPSVNFAGYPNKTWDIRLNSQTPIQLDVTTGAVKADIDLRKLLLTKFNFETGASTLKLYFPDLPGLVQANIKGGATTINIYIPSDVSARIITDSGLSTFQIDEHRFLKTDNVYASIDYESAERKLELILELGLSTVTIS